MLSVQCQGHQLYEFVNIEEKKRMGVGGSIDDIWLLSYISLSDHSVGTFERKAVKKMQFLKNSLEWDF